ncbi:phosphopantothenoylcysteine decarboxylase [Streptococcus moroccensis]|nr:phosphopantothenoylcysteine decarboxylase [Streptococcus moroccensis]
MMKRLTLAVTGSISAYKAAELVSQLGKLDYEVTVLMTKSATAFITPLTLQVLSKNQVHLDVMEEPQVDKVNHIELAKQTDLFLVAPASANTIAKLAHGLADDIVSCVALALPADTPKLIAPAMNTQMYQNPITQSNLATLTQYGYEEILPREALLACGDFGRGALADLSLIIETIEETLNAITQ